MSDELSEYVGEHVGSSRRKFLIGLLAGSAFAVPVVASFTMGGASPVAVGSMSVPGLQSSNEECEDLDAIILAGANGSNCEQPETR